MKLYVIINIILCFSHICLCQDFIEDITIEMGSKVVGIDNPFIISVIVKDAENRPSVIFPEISGLEKRSKSTTSSINTIDDKKVVVQTITQEYFANKIGNYQIPDFDVIVNNVKYKSSGTVISFFKNSVDNSAESDILNDLPDLDLSTDGVVFSVQADKESVYIREGFALRVSLYIAESAPVEMEFYEFSTQLQSILKKIRPANCWEENIGLEEIVKRRVTIKGKNYTEYNMYQAQFFPITLQDVTFPSINLDMLVLENRNTVNVKNKVIRSFQSKMTRVRVKPLPYHPFSDKVAVGQYSLVEKLSSDLVYPGESVRYIFKIQGIGNIAAIPTPQPEANSAFDFYPPEINQITKRSHQKVSGEKTFNYFIVPKKDGTFPLYRYFQWIYFNTATAKYDTLRPKEILEVKGEDYKLKNVTLNSSSGLYDSLESLDTTKKKFNYKRFFKEITNAVVIILLIAMAWVLKK